MSTTLVAVPPEDAPIISRLASILARRLVQGNDEPVQRQALLRALFALQRLPVLASDLSVSISAGYCQLAINSEQYGFYSYTDDGHTEFRIEYFTGTSHCICGYDFLEGEEKTAAAHARLDDFASDMETGQSLIIEDNSTAGEIDVPPIDDYLEYVRTDDQR